MTTSRPLAIAPLRKAVRVPQAPDAAFRLFTAEIGRWWPLATHSVGGTTATDVTFEQGEGGRIVESMASGDTAVWGTVTVWQPPHRVRFSWHPGRPADEATDVEVTFTASPDGTLVELVHGGWERRPDGAAARADYATGWDPVLERYAAITR